MRKMLQVGLLLLLTRISSTIGGYVGSCFTGDYEMALYLDKTHFAGAMVKCRSQQKLMWLAELTRDDLQEAARCALNGDDDVWLGATDLSAEGRWYWLEGEDVQMGYTNWEKGEPNDFSGEDCMLMRKDSQWNDKDCCTQQGGYICQTYEQLPYKFSHSEFDILESPLNFKQAQEACATRGARLVEITDAESEESLRKKMKFGTQQLWISRAENDISTCATIDGTGTRKEDCYELKSATLCEKVRPHAIKASQRKISASTEARVEVDCTAEGHPIPDVVWHKDGKEVSAQVMSAGRSKLILQNAKGDDAGLYLCYATNDVNRNKYDLKTFMNLEVTTD